LHLVENGVGSDFEKLDGIVEINDGVSTDSVLKRGIYGTFHMSARDSLGRYVDQFAFRLNEGNVERHTLRWLDSFC
jgi:hypothetical protein